jgi:hypothetical protein
LTYFRRKHWRFYLKNNFMVKFFPKLEEFWVNIGTPTSSPFFRRKYFIMPDTLLRLPMALGFLQPMYMYIDWIRRYLGLFFIYSIGSIGLSEKCLSLTAEGHS